MSTINALTHIIEENRVIMRYEIKHQIADNWRYEASIRSRTNGDLGRNFQP
jgi:hypothetical protein